jgi:hypothetical protein
MELKVVRLQQREEEGEEWEYEPRQGVGGEEDEFIGPQAIEWNISTPHPPIKL